MGTRIAMLALSALLGAAAMYGTTEAQMPVEEGLQRRRQANRARTRPASASSGAVYLSGQIGLDPASGQLVEGGTEAQARRVMENLGAVLKEAGLGFGDVVKTTIYMTDLAEFAKVNDIYATYFPAGGVPPARSTVQVAALPRGARIEIDFVAAR